MHQIASLEEIGRQFGTSSPRRQFLFEQLKILTSVLRTTGSVKAAFLFGSFVTGKVSPNDIDLFVVMRAGFSTADLSQPTLTVFQHDNCRIRYHADVFWVTETVGEDRINDVLDVFSRDRQGRSQSIFEVKL
jgi:Polymerase beta, Nucleotidyltransferase